MKRIGIPRLGSGPLRPRDQVLCAVLIIMAPYLLVLAVSPPPAVSIKLMTVTAGYSLCATLFGGILLRSVSHYPGVEAHTYILPSFATSYGFLLAILVLARLPYSRVLLFSSFGLALVCFTMAHVIAARRYTLTIGIVPGSDQQMPTMPVTARPIRWVMLSDPGQDTADLHAITADLRVDLPQEWDRQLADFALAGMPVYHTKHLVESLTGKVQLEHLSENNFGTLAPVSAFMTAKHIVDWITAAIAAVILAPFLLLIALAIRLDSPGWPIFRQTRVGYRGRRFTVYKFRTMQITESVSTELDAAKTKNGDRRITRLGAFLRRSRIDELPQVLNILKGEMTWIGPRPEAQVLSEWYEREIPFYRYRHIVRPGLTGWAQVNQGHVAEVEDVREKLYYDFYYIKHFSPWIDFLIFARTIRIIFTGFGAR